MFGTAKKIYPAAAAGLVALAALAACGGEQSVASKSAAAFREAQKKGQTFEEAGHSHGHGAMTPGGGHEMPDAAPEASAGGHAEMAEGGMEGMAGMDHAGMAHGGKQGMAGMDHSRMAQGGKQGMAGMDHSGMAQEGKESMAGMDHSQMAPRDKGGMEGMDHAGMGHGGSAPAAAQGGMAGMDHSAGRVGGMPPATPVPALEPPSPGQPERTLRPDALDAPAASSVLDAQRSAEMAEGMAGMTGGGHGGHGSATYRHVDAGLESGAAPATPAPSSHEEEHEHTSGAAETAATVYACPMHPEVTSETPGSCPKCGMTLVERRKG